MLGQYLRDGRAVMFAPAKYAGAGETIFPPSTVSRQEGLLPNSGSGSSNKEGSQESGAAGSAGAPNECGGGDYTHDATLELCSSDILSYI